MPEHRGDLWIANSVTDSAIARCEVSDGVAGRSIYQLLQHYRLAAEDPGIAADPIRYLGRSLHRECCGFFDTDPGSGRVTVPQEGAHLHLHGCSLDLQHGGHLHHEHPGTALAAVKRFALYPLQRLHQLARDLGFEDPPSVPVCCASMSSIAAPWR